MSKPAKIWIVRLLKIAIAVLGLLMVIWLPWKPEPSITWRDRATVRAGTEIRGVKFLEPLPVFTRVSKDARGTLNPAVRDIAPSFFSARPMHVFYDGKEHQVTVDHAVIRQVFDPDENLPPRGPVGSRYVEWVRSFSDVNWTAVPAEYLVYPPEESTLAKEPVVTVGLKRLIVEANPWYLLLAWVILGFPFLVTSWRWKMLMEPQGIKLPYSKCLALTFVGQFYSTLLPGITGGDLVKIIYASKVTGSKTKSTVTILLDRVIGLLALLVIAGLASAALLLFDKNLTADATSAKTIRNVAILSWGILGVLAVGTMLYFSRRVRKFLKIDRLTESTKERLAARAAARERGETVPEDAALVGFEKTRKRLAEIVVQFDDVLHAYRGHTGVLFWAFGASLIVQIISPLSGYFVGCAFGMNVPMGYYFAFIPLGLLAASVPVVPPGGIGVTENVFGHFFGQRLPEAIRASGSQTFALAQGVRFLPIVWNLIGAYWVITGTYTRHEAVEESHHDPAVEGEKAGA